MLIVSINAAKQWEKYLSHYLTGDNRDMGLLTIDRNLCKKDGLCVAECPSAIIHEQETGFPDILPEKEAGCIECGHCVAVCPFGALDHERVPLASSPLIQEDLCISGEQAIQFLRSRRSIRRFLDRPVEKEKIQKLIEAARCAPTGGNSQMVEWLVITEKERLKKIAGMTVDWMRVLAEDPRVVAAAPYLPAAVAAWDAGCDSVLRGAPALVVAMAPAKAINGYVDLTLALSYFDLLAPVLGLGTCWAGMLQGALANAPGTKAAVGIPEGYPHHYPIMLGYHTVRYYRMPDRKNPRITFA
jgi:nitroreductase/NAD-dependent dihydropyrimidine dehydrogenase PreA subunit